jgi:uncharacterized Zn-binding protein involved in type VI secretion
MPAAARKNDQGEPHKQAPFVINDGSPNVFINGQPAARYGDPSTAHLKHVSKIAAASETVFVNGQGLARVGDPLGSCTKIKTGSENVNVG